MWVVVGLGNPGAAYADTRHNVGFMVLETLARRWNVPMHSRDVVARRGAGTIAGHGVRLVEPQTFMNRSADALDDLAPDDAVIAVYDDLDLAEGYLRVRPRGGTGGHRGVTSLVSRLGDEFVRVRIGIGRPPARGDAATYVLEALSGAQRVALQAVVERASDAVECIIADGTHAAMNRYNGRPAGPI